jgi:serine/threonine protein kinase
LSKIGKGGFASVFKAKRNKDGFECALKFMEPANDGERNSILREVGIM